MTLTRIDCQFYRGAAAESASFAALNPARKPGSIVAAGSSAGRESLGGQVACKLALEHFVDGVLEFFDPAGQSGNGGDITLEVLESAFRRANSSVYQFGHQLAAGGRLAASLIGVVIQNSVVATGRVGSGSAYLYRAGELFPFFEQRSQGSEVFIGANSVVSVELASVPIEETDTIFVFSETLSVELESDLLDFLDGADLRSSRLCSEVIGYLFPEIASVSFGMVLGVGPDTIYLSEALPQYVK